MGHARLAHGVVPLGEVPATLVNQLEVSRFLDIELDRLTSNANGRDHLGRTTGAARGDRHANHAKNVFVGAGGSDLINKSHWPGVYGIDASWVANTPVRSVLDCGENPAGNYPFHLRQGAREILPSPLGGEGSGVRGNLVTRGIYAGDDRACFERGAELCRQVNLDRLERAPKKVVVYLDPLEFKSTWLGNKAVYRTRMAIAVRGELIVLAPGVRTFGEDATIDRLILRFGYRGTPHTLEMVRAHQELRTNLSASAHLIHGSSEGRFTITYCPGHLTRDGIEGVGFQFGELAQMMARYDPNRLKDGWNRLADGEEVYYISNQGSAFGAQQTVAMDPGTHGCAWCVTPHYRAHTACAATNLNQQHCNNHAEIMFTLKMPD